MKINLKFLYAGLILLVLFVGYTFFVSTDIFSTSDYQLTVFIQKIVPDFLVLPLSSLSILGSAEVTGLLLLAIIFLFLGIRKLYIVIFFVLTGIVELFFKSVIHQPGLPRELQKTIHFFGLPSGDVSHGFFAYPSGHSARFAFISLILVFAIWLSPRIKIETKKILIILIFIADLVMFVSRVFLGEHWPTDVIGGILLGYGLAFICGYLLFSFKTKKQ